MRTGWGFVIVVAAVTACGGDPFTASSTDGGASDAGGNDGSSDATSGTEGGSSDASVGDGALTEAGFVDGGRSDATPCTATCPTGFACVGAACIDDAAAHFSPTQNPSGNWTYGWSAQLASTFTPYLLHSTVMTTLQVWDVTAGSLLPSVFLNSSSAMTVYGGKFTMTAGELGFHPGAANEHSIIRWTAPATARYAIDSVFSGLSGAGGSALTTVSVTVLINGSVASGKTINTNGGANTVPFVQAHNQLNAGSIVDFIVDYGNDGNSGDDPTGLRAVITTE
jgi:hypothetical protein